MVNVPFSAAFRDTALPRYTPGGQGFVTDRELRARPQLLVPEVNSGFSPVWWYKASELTDLAATDLGAEARPGSDARPSDLEGRALPLWYKADTGPGHYKITARLTSRSGCGEVLLFVSRRRLAWRGSIPAGGTAVVTALCDVSPIVAVGGGDAAVSDQGRTEDVSVDVAVIGAALAELSVEPWAGPALYLMGDSTVTDQRADWPYAPGVNYAGWGQALPLYLGDRYCVSNHAHSGLSTETFRELGHYDVMRPLVRPGDVVLIQFGHNDQKRIRLAADTGYTDNLTAYIHELRDLGAAPALVTPLARNTWKSDTEYNDMLLPFADAMKRIGARENVPVLDLHAAMKGAILAAGMEAAKPWFHPCDYTHLNDFGAHMAAGFVAAEMVRAGLTRPYDVPVWPVHGPMAGLPRPSAEELQSLTPPAEAAELVDYGLIPDAPWPIT